MSGPDVDQAQIDAAITRDFENDLADMTDEQIAQAIRDTQDIIDEEAPWLEALCVRQRQRAEASASGAR